MFHVQADGTHCIGAGHRHVHTHGTGGKQLIPIGGTGHGRAVGIQAHVVTHQVLHIVPLDAAQLGERGATFRVHLAFHLLARGRFAGNLGFLEGNLHQETGIGRDPAAIVQRQRTGKTYGLGLLVGVLQGQGAHHGRVQHAGQGSPIALHQFLGAHHGVALGLEHAPKAIEGGKMLIVARGTGLPHLPRKGGNSLRRFHRRREQDGGNRQKRKCLDTQKTHDAHRYLPG